MNRPYRAAVIPTRDRHGMLADCISSVVDQVDTVLIIDNQSNPPIDVWSWHGNVISRVIHMDPPNISALWNEGLELAAIGATLRGVGQWDAVVLNSDVIVPPGWVDTLSEAMRSTTAVLAYPDQCGGQEQILHTKAEPVDLRQRITGYAYMLRGEAGLRLDESMAWWYSDDSLDWEAREKGGSLLVPGIPVQHRCPNESTEARPELQAQAARDRETFIAKHGKAPH
ncbi:glycosyltransferase family 2 protein [Streptomyces sp. NPDC057580]|uniref:glycosyltransferase family 2 protein n=1 Tax=Streptomyces sp. NPDC057580 TaxID=3346173 RepID=UPI003682F9EB